MISSAFSKGLGTKNRPVSDFGASAIFLTNENLMVF